MGCSIPHHSCRDHPSPLSLNLFIPSLSRNCTRPCQSSASRAAQIEEEVEAVRVPRRPRDVQLWLTSMAVMAFCYGFARQMEGGQVPWSEMLGTFALSVGAAVGMEFWKRWAPRALWHASLSHTHESHHRPREGELNDVFAIIITVPAIALLFYGFFHVGLVPGLCFRAGLGITVFGMADVFVHSRFRLGPIANVRRVAASAAHQMATGEGKFQRVKLLVLLALLGGRYDVASARSTLVFKNNCSIPISPSLIPTDGSPKINHSTSLSTISPNQELPVPLPDGWSGIAIFGTGCTSNGLGTRNCTTGNCEGRDCTADDSPVATSLGISNDSYTMSTSMGYNVGLTVSPMSSDCPSASCKAQLGSCLHDRRVSNEGTVVACKPGSGLNCSENQCTVPGYDCSSNVSITCPLENIIVKIEVSC